MSQIYFWFLTGDFKFWHRFSHGAGISSDLPNILKYVEDFIHMISTSSYLYQVVEDFVHIFNIILRKTSKTSSTFNKLFLIINLISFPILCGRICTIDLVVEDFETFYFLVTRQ